MKYIVMILLAGSLMTVASSADARRVCGWHHGHYYHCHYHRR
jgi:hypothetical protein